MLNKNHIKINSFLKNIKTTAKKAVANHFYTRIDGVSMANS